MVKDELAEFLSEKVEQAKPDASVDTQALMAEWQNAIELLYRTITEDYLSTSLAQGLAHISYADKEIIEPVLGRYFARVLVLRVGDQQVEWIPKGLQVVGVKGRIDLRGERGLVTFVRDQEADNGPGGWSIIESRTPVLKRMPLSKESLLTALRNVMR